MTHRPVTTLSLSDHFFDRTLLWSTDPDLLILSLIADGESVFGFATAGQILGAEAFFSTAGPQSYVAVHRGRVSRAPWQSLPLRSAPLDKLGSVELPLVRGSQLSPGDRDTSRLLAEHLAAEHRNARRLFTLRQQPLATAALAALRLLAKFAGRPHRLGVAVQCKPGALALLVNRSQESARRALCELYDTGQVAQVSGGFVVVNGAAPAATTTHSVSSSAVL